MKRMMNMGRMSPRETGNQSKIARKRIEAGLTQSQLGALVGVQGTYVGAWERGERKPKLDALMRLAAVLECDVADLIG